MHPEESSGLRNRRSRGQSDRRARDLGMIGNSGAQTRQCGRE